MLFSTFATHLQRIEATTKRLEMTQLLATLFRELEESEVSAACYLLQGRLVPLYESLEFQLSIKMMVRALARVDSQGGEQQSLLGDDPVPRDAQKEREITELYKKVGDLGSVAEQLGANIGSLMGHSLTILQVFQQLQAIATLQGKGSQEMKLAHTIELLRQLDAGSRKYVIRIIVSNMRLGFSDMTMIDALSWALSGDKSQSTQIEDAYQRRADIGHIASVVLGEGVAALEKVQVQVGTPVIPALCQRLNSAQEIIEKMGNVFAEPKYDGTRVQIHVRKTPSASPATLSKSPQLDGATVPQPLSTPLIRTFTRNMEESSHMFPELLSAVKDVDCDSCILDAEAIGYDPLTGKLLPFQQTIQRKRKHGVAETAEKIPLRFFVFDILEKNGHSKITLPLRERKQLLSQLFIDTKVFIQAPYIETDDPLVLHQFHEEQLGLGLEGAVIKKVDGEYQSGRKSFNWVKIKEAEGNRGKLSDTVDGIVMGYFYPTGARVAYGVGSLLVGVPDPQGNIVTISKVGSGLSEENSKQFLEIMTPLIVKEKPTPYQIKKELTPDVYIHPQLVIEIAADEVTTSKLHTAGKALRFPRFVRFREDKSWQQATSLEEIQSLEAL